MVQTLLKLLALCFVVGLVITAAGIQPIDLWRDLGGTIVEIWRIFWDAAHWAVRYVVLGAIVVVPVWLLLLVFQKAAEARRSP
jgi:hypothetical protein